MNMRWLTPEDLVDLVDPIIQDNELTPFATHTMKKLLIILSVGLTAFIHVDAQTNSTPSADQSGQTVETIVCIRHGEKPPGGLGQLTCQGLNRALALPDVLLAKYGKPQFVFAPNPTQKVDGDRYYYVRPLMTIEPTAIRCGLPVNTEFGYREIKGLEDELEKPEYDNATIFVAWEHGMLDEFARKMVKHHGGNVSEVPRWPGSDYDTIFVFKITRNDGRESFKFSIDHEGLNNLSTNCP
jgi:hypothetical protein